MGGTATCLDIITDQFLRDASLAGEMLRDFQHLVCVCRRSKGDDQHGIECGANASASSDSLPTQCVRPGEVEVHDGAGFLQVDAFCQQVGGEE